MEGKLSDAEKYRNELREVFAFAERKKLVSVTERSGHLHTLVIGNSRPNHQMKNCCRIMNEFIEEKDVIISQPLSRQSSTVEIQYFFPRKNVI